MLLPPGFAEDRSPILGQYRVAAAAVVCGTAAFDESAPLEPIGKSGEPAGRHQSSSGEVGHAHALTAGFAEERQDAVLGHAHVDAIEPGFQLSPDPVVGEQESAPCFVLELTQLLDRHVETLVPARAMEGIAHRHLSF